MKIFQGSIFNDFGINNGTITLTAAVTEIGTKTP